ncbi:HEPN domain-containing protein [Enterobacter bugandensis]|uniref:HEPN domain-containing protein n=1 Tax=Enterobacter bugandensis TaxID=881260 RepID=UPI000AB023FC|nr:HEPN domain-containing protein [Enterobacter bugandensis]
MVRFDNAITTFQHAISRSVEMISLYDALVALRRNQPENDDALRSAYFQVVSSFDFLAHEIAAIEGRFRFESSLQTRNLSLPMEIITITDVVDRVNAAEIKIRHVNSFKAFVDPGKLAEMLSCYCEQPWEKIADAYNLPRDENDKKTAEELKTRLKNIWKRRNQIAHEADVNPTMAGISLWPITKEDTQLTVEFIRELGECLPTVISQPLNV